MFDISTHPIFQDSVLGTDAWWKKIEHMGTPLFIREQEKTKVIFIIRQLHYSYYFIDVYSHTLHVSKQLTKLENIQGTDIFIWETYLPHDWLGTYCIVGANEQQPPNGLTLRAWWIQLLTTQCVYDSFNTHYYQSGFRRNYILNLSSQLLPKNLTKTHVLKPFRWTSKLTQKTRKIWIYDARIPEETTCQLVLLFDGEIWANQLSIVPKIQQWKEENSIQSSIFIFIDQIDQHHRYEDLGINLDFITSIFEELLPIVHKKMNLYQPSFCTVVGESLGGLSALYSAIKYPKSINQVIALSSSLWWQQIEQSIYPNFITYFKKNSFRLNPNLKIHLLAGSLETDMRLDAEQFFYEMKDKIHVKYTTFYGGHDWVCWYVALIDGIYKQLKKEVCNVANSRKLSQSL